MGADARRKIGVRQARGAMANDLVGDGESCEVPPIDARKATARKKRELDMDMDIEPSDIITGGHQL